jgi:hypothetical protein
MSLLVEDTARNNLASWTIRAVEAGHARGGVISPFTTPRLGTTYKQSGDKTAERLRDANADVWFDAATHALQMPNVGDFRYYDDWPLWPGAKGMLETDGDQRDHIERVFAIQDGLQAPHLGPTILLHSPQSNTSQRALRMAEIATGLDPGCHITIAGDSAFWAGGSALDAHIGGLAQVEPAGWFLVVTRNIAVLPVPAAQEEVHGLCRTARALSEDGPVHISHGDLAGLPAIVAGASSVGTGWDPRQRVCAYASYEQRTAGGDGGQWFAQKTLRGLLSLLGRAETLLLATQNAELAARLLPGATVPPGAQEGWDHHASVLSGLVTSLQPAGAASYESLQNLYTAARTDWGQVASTISCASEANAWLGELELGLARFAHTEGW